MKKYMNKFRIPSARLQSWDYSDNGAYFITICTQNRQHYFGKIFKQRFIPNDTGILAEKYWSEIPIHFPFVELGNFVVMPNHVHGILIIDKNARVPSVETRLIASLPSEINTPSNSHKTGGITGAKNPMHHENISRIIRWYKGRCSFEMRKIQPDFAWQSRFHDHIIRDPESFERIQTYIERNPLNWKKDRFSK